MHPAMEIIIYEDKEEKPRKTGIYGWATHGNAVLDCRTPENRKPPERPYLSPEDKAAKDKAEEYVRKHLVHG